MMAIAASAKEDGLFAWAAVRVIRASGRSRLRLFALVYGAGIVTTALYSNDATVVVLTPAVIEALRRFDASPLPYVVACALTAGAASFVLPISNPSNLLFFAGRIPGLAEWLNTFGLPSLAAIAVTFAVVAWFYAADLRGRAARTDDGDARRLPATGAALTAGAAIVLLVVSSRHGPLGAAAFACGGVMWLVSLARDRGAAVRIVRDVHWSIVPFTAALFVIVSTIDAAGGFAATRFVLERAAQLAPPLANLVLGFAAALAANLINNLPVALNAGETLPAVHASAPLTAAALIGVNLGPNATANGSLATILWLSILRRANIAMTPLGFATVGIATTIPALIAALLLVR